MAITARMAFGYEMHNFAQIVFYFCYILLKNAKKCKKMQKNLHISKICCNFAPEFEKPTK